jgi:plasmid stabilization system protein ParE
VKVSLTARAKEDLADIFLWYEENGGSQLAGKFLESANAAVLELKQTPLIGRRRKFRSRHLRGARSWPLPKPFAVYLAFYQAKPDEVVILRVLHGMHDLPSLLEGTL